MRPHDRNLGVADERDRQTKNRPSASNQTAPVIIVGAGLSGLACAHALAQRGVPVTVLEAEERVAEPWRRRHPRLRLNVHRRYAQLPGRSVAKTDGAKTDGAFLRRDTLVRYLEGYAAALPVDIQFGVAVRGVARSETGWRLDTSRGFLRCAHVIFATGRDRTPSIPDWPGRDRFEGRILHAADFGDAARFDGERVLVVGAGNSGGDVLNHLARCAPAEVAISVRHGPAIVPARVFGFPLHRAAGLFAAMPLWLVDPAFRLTQRLAFGDLRRYGLPSHPVGGGTRLVKEGVAFAVDQGFVAAIKQGRFKLACGVRRFEANRVEFEDGALFRPDVVIAATGYRTGLAPILGDLGVLDEMERPLRPSGEVDPRNPGLWFAGYRAEFRGYFHSAAATARSVANEIARQQRAAAASAGVMVAPAGARSAASAPQDAPA